MTKQDTRIIIETPTPGWFLLPDTDKKTRKKDGDTVLTAAQYAERKQAEMDAQDAPVKAKAHAEQEAEVLGTAAAAQKPKPAVRPKTKGDGDKLVVIQDCWVDPENRTKAQAKLFAGPKRALSYEKIVKAAGGDKKALPTGEKREVKPQDAFQVRFTVENQKKYALEQRRTRQRAKKESK